MHSGRTDTGQCAPVEQTCEEGTELNELGQCVSIVEQSVPVS